MCAIRGRLGYGVSAVPEKIPEFGGVRPAGKAAGKPDDGDRTLVDPARDLLRRSVLDRRFPLFRRTA